MLSYSNGHTVFRCGVAPTRSARANTFSFLPVSEYSIGPARFGPKTISVSSPNPTPITVRQPVASQAAVHSSIAKIIWCRTGAHNTVRRDSSISGRSLGVIAKATARARTIPIFMERCITFPPLKIHATERRGSPRGRSSLISKFDWLGDLGASALFITRCTCGTATIRPRWIYIVKKRAYCSSESPCK